MEISRVDGMKSISPFATEKRKDTAVDKRIELHCHTKMSDMDGVSECKKIVRRAYEWGHKRTFLYFLFKVLKHVTVCQKHLNGMLSVKSVISRVTINFPVFVSLSSIVII